MSRRLRRASQLKIIARNLLNGWAAVFFAIRLRIYLHKRRVDFNLNASPIISNHNLLHEEGDWRRNTISQHVADELRIEIVERL